MEVAGVQEVGTPLPVRCPTWPSGDLTHKLPFSQAPVTLTVFLSLTYSRCVILNTPPPPVLNMEETSRNFTV